MKFINSIRLKYKIYGFRVFLSFVIAELSNRIIHQVFQNSYSQCKEDIIIDKLLGNKKAGFYIDVGAYDPHRFNNTKRFYKRGWRGINIEPNPINHKRFLINRKGDINLNVAIGQKNMRAMFYSFIPDTSSTTSKNEAEKNKKLGYKLINSKSIKINRLDTVIQKYAGDKHIDFISIDVEGHNLEVLKSNNWNKFRPTVICIETAEDLGVNKAKESEKRGVGRKIDKYLISKGYVKKYTNKINSIYKIRDHQKPSKIPSRGQIL